jgi:hypothetical protein
VRELKGQGLGAKALGIGWASVYRVLEAGQQLPSPTRQ